MAKYGTRRYASGFKYGELSTVGVYYEANLIATSLDYNIIQITWGSIIPDPADPAITHWKLVRSHVGSLDNPDDATFVAGGSYLSGGFKNNHTDTLNSATSQEVHYSLWVFNGLNWINCGEDYEIAVAVSNSIDTLTRWVPKAWLNPTSTFIGDGIGENENNTLYKVLSMYAFVYDQLRAQANLLNLTANPIYTPSTLLRYGVTDLGLTYEPALGDSYHRSLYGTGSIINANKGTKTGISAYVTALTHWSADITEGHNLMLDYNDSSFEESLGRWTASSGTLTQKTYAVETGVLVPSKTQVLFDPIFKPRLLGFAQLTTAATTAVTLSLPGNGNDITIYGISVKENTRYLFSGQVLHRDNAANVTAIITWYNMFGMSLGSTAAATALTTTTSWKEFTTSSDSGRNGRLSPIGAKFAKVTITATPSSASSSRFAFDLFQFAEAYDSLEYQDAKLVKVEAVGDKENYLSNGNFESGLFGWSASSGSLAIDKNITSGVTTYGVHGTQCLKFTASAANAAIVSDWVAIDPGKSLTFSAYILGTSTDTAVAKIEFSQYVSEEEQTSILSDAEGQYYPTSHYTVESSAMTLSVTEKKQISVTATTPSYTKDSGYPLAKVTIYFPQAINTRVYYVDGAMIENVDTASRFFSGIGGIAPTDPSTQQYYSTDYTRWETKNIVNYMSNPGFDVNTTDWSSTGTLTRVTTDASLGPLFGTHFGKVVYTTSTAITGVAYLPYAAEGGEDFIVSAYVRGPAATYTINGTSYTVPSSDTTVWHRISGVYSLTAGATSLSWTISVVAATPSVATYFHIDSTQAEYGRIPHRYVDAADGTNTTALANPINSAKNMYAIQGESTYSGKSNFLYNYEVKLSRLQNTLTNFVANGTTVSVKTGHENYGYPDLKESLIPNNSFETSLGSWVSVNSTLSRVLVRGAEFNEDVTHGQAYAKVTTAGSAGSVPFGIKTSKVYISDSASYYASVALRPNAANAAGTFALKVEFFNAQDVSVYSKTNTKTFTTTTRWAYLADTYSIANIAGAAYAILSVTATPTGGYVSGQNFHIDRVVFRE
jgi:hypothetical protein